MLGFYHSYSIYRYSKLVDEISKSIKKYYLQVLGGLSFWFTFNNKVTNILVKFKIWFDFFFF